MSPQKMLADGDFLIPVLLGSDETFLTNFSGDKNIWPLYVSIGNIPSNIRNKPSKECWRLLATLPTRPKSTVFSVKRKNATEENPYTSKKYAIAEEQQQAAEIVQEVLRIVLEPLKRLYEEGIEVVCPDGKVRRGHPKIYGWIADYPEYIKLFTIANKSCPICIVPSANLGDHPKMPWDVRNNTELRQQLLKYIQAEKTRDKLSRDSQTNPENKKANDSKDKEVKRLLKLLEEWFARQRVKIVDNFLWQLPGCSPTTLWKPDMLHTIFLGMYDHVFRWTLAYLESLDLHHRFNDTWLLVPYFPGLPNPKKKYTAVKQWSGKEMRRAGRHFLAALEATLAYPKQGTSQHVEFGRVIKCVGGLIDFSLMMQYRSHTYHASTPITPSHRYGSPSQTEPDPASTLSWACSYLWQFYDHINVFAPYRASKKVKAAAKKLAQSVRTPNDVLKDMTPGQRSWQKEQDNLAVEAAERQHLVENSAFDFPKIHLLTHFISSISAIGALPNWSSEITETNHKLILEGWKKSNRVNATGQIFRNHSHDTTMRIRVQNLLHISREAPELRQEIQEWLHVYDESEKALRDARSKANRARMNPGKTLTASERRLASSKKAEDGLRALAEHFMPAGEEGDYDEDHDNSDDDGFLDDSGNSEEDLGMYHDDDHSGRLISLLKLKPGRHLAGSIVRVNAESGWVKAPSTFEGWEMYSGLNNLLAETHKCIRGDVKLLATDYSIDSLKSAKVTVYQRLVIRRPVFQQPDELENHTILVTGKKRFYTSDMRNDFIFFRSGSSGSQHEVLQDQLIAATELLFKVEVSYRTKAAPRETLRMYYKLAAIRALTPERYDMESKRMVRVGLSPDARLKVIPIGSVTRCANIVPILPKSYSPLKPQLDPSEKRLYVVNNRIDLETFSEIY